MERSLQAQSSTHAFLIGGFYRVIIILEKIKHMTLISYLVRRDKKQSAPQNRPKLLKQLIETRERKQVKAGEYYARVIEH